MNQPVDSTTPIFLLCKWSMTTAAVERSAYYTTKAHAIETCEDRKFLALQKSLRKRQPVAFLVKGA